jgi:hypothetical protein
VARCRRRRRRTSWRPSPRRTCCRRSVSSQSRGRCYDFLNIFVEFFGEKNGVFDQTTAIFCQNFIITLVFEKTANFFAENWQTSQKIVIITSATGANPTTFEFTTTTPARAFFWDYLNSSTDDTSTDDTSTSNASTDDISTLKYIEQQYIDPQYINQCIGQIL